MSDRDEGRAADIDTSVPHSARIWNYWLGGKDNYPVDRIAGDEYVKTFPGITTIARLTRHFLKRSGEAGLRQFLDVGTLLEPGLVPCLDWRPEMAHAGDRPPVQPLAGIARKA